MNEKGIGGLEMTHCYKCGGSDILRLKDGRLMCKTCLSIMENPPKGSDLQSSSVIDLVSIYMPNKKNKSIDELSGEKLYKKGKDLENSNLLEKAFYYYNIGAEKGDLQCIFKVANAYETGKGIIKDLDKAYFWYKIGSDKKDERCTIILKERFNNEFNFKSDFTSLFKQLIPSVVCVGTTNTIGTGFIIENGYIVTNAHVVLNEENMPQNESFTISFAKELNISPFRATIYHFDATQDIAILTANNPKIQDISTVKLGNSDELVPGQDVFTIGNGRDYGLAFTKFNVAQAARYDERFSKYEEIIQLSGDIHPGNSGGPLFNLKGEVIGITTFHPVESHIVKTLVATESGVEQVGQIINTPMNGIGFAITSNTLKTILKKIK